MPCADLLDHRDVVGVYRGLGEGPGVHDADEWVVVVGDDAHDGVDGAADGFPGSPEQGFVLHQAFPHGSVWQGADDDG